MVGPVVCNVAGLMANLAGVILLFHYGMPFRVRTKGQMVRVLAGPPNQEAVKLERHYDALGWLGLALVVLGTFAQIAGSVTS